VETDDLLVNFSDFSVSAAKLAKVLSAGDTLGFYDLLLSGNDTFNAASGPTTLFGFDGNDTMNGGAATDEFLGDRGDDTLNGNGGNDDLIGGPGADRLTGGKGEDAFTFSAVSDSRPAAFDTIADLTRGDVIVLTDIDADSANGSATNEDFVLVKHFTHA